MEFFPCLHRQCDGPADAAGPTGLPMCGDRGRELFQAQGAVRVLHAVSNHSASVQRLTDFFFFQQGFHSSTYSVIP
jgi:hypothetical protein